MSDKQASAERTAQVKKLEKLLSSRKKPFTIEELIAKFNVQGNTIRQWLRVLDAKVTISDAPKKGPGKGRPPKQYTILGDALTAPVPAAPATVESVESDD